MSPRRPSSPPPGAASCLVARSASSGGSRVERLPTCSRRTLPVQPVMAVAELLTPPVTRARPWHAGPEATARDLAALRFVGEQYAARLDVLAAVLGRLSHGQPRAAGRLGSRTVRQRVERWEAAGWAVRRRMLDHSWVLATRAGIRLAGLELDPWTPALDRLAH